jgi:uncharacterized protein (TIGR02444 family)
MTDLSLPAFAKALYARPGVREACLYLQDEAGRDVVLVLAGAWAGARGWQLDPAEWRHLERALAPWRTSVVEPLRGVRRYLKAYSGEPDLQDLRKDIQAAEIAAELRSLQWLEARIPGLGRSETVALTRNLEAVAGTGMTALVQRVFEAGVRLLPEQAAHEPPP